jgi:hypothetical protein
MNPIRSLTPIPLKSILNYYYYYYYYYYLFKLQMGFYPVAVVLQ